MRAVAFTATQEWLLGSCTRENVYISVAVAVNNSLP